MGMSSAGLTDCYIWLSNPPRRGPPRINPIRSSPPRNSPSIRRSPPRGSFPIRTSSPPKSSPPRNSRTKSSPPRNTSLIGSNPPRKWMGGSFKEGGTTWSSHHRHIRVPGCSRKAWTNHMLSHHRHKRAPRCSRKASLNVDVILMWCCFSVFLFFIYVFVKTKRLPNLGFALILECPVPDCQIVMDFYSQQKKKKGSALYFVVFTLRGQGIGELFFLLCHGCKRAYTSVWLVRVDASLTSTDLARIPRIFLCITWKKHSSSVSSAGLPDCYGFQRTTENMLNLPHGLFIGIIPLQIFVSQALR